MAIIYMQTRRGAHQSRLPSRRSKTSSPALPGDVRGLYLQIFPSGKASWAFRYRFGGRTRKLTIAASPEIGLKDARDLARAAHLQIASGEDPGAAKQAARTDAKALPARDMVEKVAAQFLARHVKNLGPATRSEVEGSSQKKSFPPSVAGAYLKSSGRTSSHGLTPLSIEAPPFPPIAR
jgi:Arm DNA-binding domain